MSDAPLLRIAILECDTPAPNTNSKYGGYRGVFTALLHAAADNLRSSSSFPLNPRLELSAYDVVSAQEYPPLDSIDGVLLSGSKHNSFDDDPWILKLVEFTKMVLEDGRVRVIGVCFGHQIVGRALGAPVGRSDGGWEVSVTAVDLTKKGQEIFGKTAIVSFVACTIDYSG